MYIVSFMEFPIEQYLDCVTNSNAKAHADYTVNQRTHQPLCSI